MTSARDEAAEQTIAMLLASAGLSVREEDLSEVARRWRGLVSTGVVLLTGLAADGSGEMILARDRGPTS